MKDFIYAALPWIIMGLTKQILKKIMKLRINPIWMIKKKLIIISKMIKPITIWQLGCVLECVLE